MPCPRRGTSRDGRAVTAWEALVLGLVQGLTEFLPVSSSGHLVIAQTALGLEEGNNLPFDVIIHTASLAALLLYFRARIAALARGEDVAYVAKLTLATLPAVMVGLFLREAVADAFRNPLHVAIELGVTGVILLSLYGTRAWDEAVGHAPGEANGMRGGAAHARARAQPSWTGALLVGCAQAFAILPGISRSGATIVTAIWCGVAPAAAAEFSFLLGIIAIAGATLLELGEIRALAGSGQVEAMAIGVVASFVSSLVAIAAVFRLLAGRHFRWFGFYCLAAGAVFGAWLLARGG